MNIPVIHNITLEKLFRFDFLIDGQENDEDAGSVHLEFTDGSVLEMELVPDGESVVFNWKEKETLKKEDEKTDWFRIDLSERKPFYQLCGKKVIVADGLLFGAKDEKKEDMVIAGYGFQFEDGGKLVYYNAGDYAKIYVNDLPPLLPDTFKLVWKNGIFEEPKK